MQKTITLNLTTAEYEQLTSSLHHFRMLLITLKSNPENTFQDNLSLNLELTEQYRLLEKIDNQVFSKNPKNG